MTAHHSPNTIHTLFATACVAAVMTALALSPGNALAAVIDWDSGSGNFSETSNWLGGVVPGPTDLVRFKKAGSITVTFDTSSTNEDLTVSKGNVTFQSDGNIRSFFLGSASGGQSAEIFSRLNVDGSNGLLHLTTGNQLTVDSGVLSAVNGGRVTADQLKVFSAGDLEIMGPTSVVKSNGTTTINTGSSVLVDDGELQYFGPMLIDNATLTIQNSGSVTPQSTPGATLTIQNGGLLDIIDGSLSVTDSILIDNATLTEHATGVVGNVPNYTLTAQNNATVDLLRAPPSSHTIGSGQTFNILSGSSLTYSVLGSIGQNSTGTLLVSGIGSSVSVNRFGTSIGQSLSGAAATGTATFSDNATGVFGGIRVADGVGSAGTLTVDTGAAILTAGDMNIAADGSAPAGGLVTVTDAGSSIFQNGAFALTVGHLSSGMGKLEVLNNGTFTTGTGQTTVNHTGTVDLNGGTLNVLGDLFVDGGQFNHQAGDLNIGGELTVQRNGQMNILGDYDTGSGIGVFLNGDLTITGDVTLTSSNNAFISLAGNGTSFSTADVILDNNNSNNLVLYSMAVGFASTATFGDVTVHGGDAINNVDGVAVAGANSDGDVTSGNLSIKINRVGAQADVFIDGEGSTWTQNAGASLTLEGKSGTIATLEVTDNGVFTNAGNVNFLTDGRLIIDGGTANLGTLTLAGGDLQFLNGSLSYIGDLTVGTGGLLGGLDVALNSNRSLALTGTTTVDASRTLTISGGSLTTGALQIDGTLDFLSGTLRLTGPAGLTVGSGGALGSSVVLNVGQSLQVDTTTTLVSGGQLTAGGGTFSTNLLSIESGGRFSVLSGFTNTNEIQLNGDSARIDGTTLTNQSLVHGSGRIQTTLDNQAGGEIRVNAGERLHLTEGGHSNDGSVNVIGGELEVDGSFTNNLAGRIQGRDAIYRFDGGLSNAGQVQLTFGTSDIFGAITNAGSLINSGGGNVTFYDDIQNDGEVRTSTGSQSVFFGNYTGVGVLTGSGSNFFEGGFSPGASPFVTTSTADASFGFLNVFTAELAGALRGVGSASQYDGLDVLDGKALSLGGTLDVVLIDDLTVGYLPDLGNAFVLLTAASILGEFRIINLPTLGSGLDWLINNNGTEFSLTVVSSPVPLPGAVWLLVSALAFLLRTRKRGHPTLT